MIARGFKSVMWVAAVGGAALGCYMVSLQVATERAELARVESQIIAAKREIRGLQTELGTRGRLSQLEHWNADVLALAAPASAQFLDNELTLARFEQSGPTVEQRSAEVRMASVESQPATRAPIAKPAAPIVPAISAIPASPQPVLRQASFTTAPAKNEAKPKPVATHVASSAAAGSAKADKPAPAKAKSKPVPARQRLDSTLASEIGAAARAEKKATDQGGN